MTAYGLRRRLAAEAVGTALLVATVVGSGIMVQGLTDDRALQLLANGIATGAILVVLVTVLGPVSGAHLNPGVSAAFAWRGWMKPADLAAYAAAQIAGGAAGAVLAHLMFDRPAVSAFEAPRTGAALWLSEAVAAFGLVATILGGLAAARPAIPWLVGLYIASAYWFTASTSFANPAVTLARSLTGSLAGIRMADVPGFVAAQFLGVALAALFAGWLFAVPQERRG